MVKQFTPYSNLWVVGHKWFENIQQWMHGEWQTLDAPAAERFVDDSVRTIASCMRFFKERDIESILKIATLIKGQLD